MLGNKLLGVAICCPMCPNYPILAKWHFAASCLSTGVIAFFSFISTVQASDASPQDTPITAKILRYAERLVRRYDSNSDGRLQMTEWQAMRGEPALADLDGDGTITLKEFARHVANYGHRRKIRLIPSEIEDTSPSPELLQPAASPAAGAVAEPPLSAADSLSAEAANNVTQTSPAKDDYRPGQRFFVSPRHRLQGLPAWFSARDANGDQQITMAEFAPKASQSDLKEFARYDANGDGVITAKECLRKTSSAETKQSPKSPAPASGRDTGS